MRVRIPPSAPNTMLVAKRCTKCKAAMYINGKDKKVEFINCEPKLVDMHIRKVKGTISLVGYSSNKTIRCVDCSQLALVKSFIEVKDGSQEAVR